MQTLEERFNKAVHWVAVEHNDDTPNRHIHTLVLVPGKLTKEDFLALRQAATELSLSQRQERDLASGQQQEEGRVVSFPSGAFRQTQGWTPQAKPPITTQTRSSCGEEQLVSPLEARRCSSCGARLVRIGASQGQKGAGWG